MLKKYLVILGLFSFILLTACQGNLKVIKTQTNHLLETIKVNIELEQSLIDDEGITENQEEEDYTINEKPITLTFIDDELEIVGVNVFLPSDMDFEFQFKQKNYYDLITEGYGGYFTAFDLDEFDNMIAGKPNHSSLINQDTFDTPLGPCTLKAYDADLGTAASGKTGTYLVYEAFIKGHELAYVFTFTDYSASEDTRQRFTSLLLALDHYDITSYEKVLLSEEVISDNHFDVNDDGIMDRVQIVLKDGYFTNDSDLWNASGPKWVGNHYIRVTIGNKIAEASINELIFYNDTLFFHAPYFNLVFKDYNKDGHIEFVLTEYASSNISFYHMFTINKDGDINLVEVKDQMAFTGHFTKINSTELMLVDDEIVMSYYDNTTGYYYDEYFVWNKAENCYYKRLNQVSEE